MSGAIGAKLDRVDGRAKVTGVARYTGDWGLPGLLHAVLVTSPAGPGRVAAIDVDAASQTPGVVAILTHENAFPPPVEVEAPGAEGVVPDSRTVLRSPEVLYAGQPVGVVVARSLEAAIEGAARVGVVLDPRPPQLDLEGSGVDGIFAPKSIYGMEPPDSERGDFERGWREAAVRLDVRYSTEWEHHNPIERHTTTAVWEGDRLTLYDSTQWVNGVQDDVAAVLGLPVENVRVISPFVGGAFGSKCETWPHTICAALAARHVGAPVRLEVTRQQLFGLVGGRPQTRQRVRLAASVDGKLMAIAHDSLNDTSARGDFVEPCAVPTRMLYSCPNVVTTHRLNRLDIQTPTYMRAPGHATGTFALESAMDELAFALGMDPRALRLANYADHDENLGVPWSSRELRTCYERGAQRFGWERRNPELGSQRQDGCLVGWGMATANYHTLQSPASARVKLTADGRAEVRCATLDFGTGAYTALTQVAAEVLELPPDRVHIEIGDTDFPWCPIAAGSQTMASVGTAIALACQKARQELARTGRREVEVEARSEPTREKKWSSHAWGAQFAEVQVDPELGTVRVTRFVGAFAAGRIVNPKTAHSQLLGGIAMGIGQALLEEDQRDPRWGRVVNADLAGYLVPTQPDVPDIEVILVPEADRLVNPLGVKGIGEVGITGVAAAIANAVFHATGKRVRHLPIQIEDLL